MLDRRQHWGGSSVVTCFQLGPVSEALLLSLPRFAPCGCRLPLSGPAVQHPKPTYTCKRVFSFLFCICKCKTSTYMITFLSCHVIVFAVGPVCSFASIADVSICLTTQSAFSSRGGNVASCCEFNTSGEPSHFNTSTNIHEHPQASTK